MTMKLAWMISLALIGGAAQASVVQFQGQFKPEAVGATGTGTLMLAYDDLARTLWIDALWSGLSGTTTNAHIHCCTASPNTGTAGVALAQAGTLPGWVNGITAGSYQRLVDLSLANQYSGTYLTISGGTTALAEKRLIDNLMSGQAYFNIHTSTFGGGEIRAFVSKVPEPAAYALVVTGLLAAGLFSRRRQKH
jgi:hypothetical protein